MLTIIIIMFCGIALGRLLRHRKLPWLGVATNVLIWLLLFLLGIEVGNDDRIIRGIASLGLEALVIALAGVAGGAVLSLLLWRYTSKNRNS